MIKLIFFIFCFCSFSAIGQDLTGIWRGHFRSAGNRGLFENLMGEAAPYKLELQLDQRSKRFNGVTYSYKTTVFYGKATCSGAVNTKTKKVLIDELQIVELRMVSGSACVMTYFLQYSKSGDEEFMEGTYSSINTSDSTSCGGGTVFLRRVTTSDFYKEPFLIKREQEKTVKKAPVIANNKPATAKPNPNAAKKPVTTSATTKPLTKSSTSTTTKPVTTPPAKKSVTNPSTSTTKKPTQPQTKPTQKPPAKNPSSTQPSKNVTVKVIPIDSTKKIERKPLIITPKVLLTRENELVKTIATDANEITINLYDNGSIDNDTVSVYLDKKLVVMRQRLTEKPISIKFPLDENSMYHELVMVAENLGEIPPNTSLMVVKAGTKSYEVRITSNEQKNAVVIFKYEKGK